MPTKQELTIHGVKVLRPEPTNPDSLRCRLGFHDMVCFAIEGNFILGRFPEYCTRCNEYTSGLKIPQRPKMPKMPMPKIKPAKISGSRDLSIEHAKELLQANGYVVYLVSDRAKGGEIKSVETYTVGENGPRTHQFFSPDNKVHTVKHPHSENTKPADAAKFASHAPITGGHKPPGDE